MPDAKCRKESSERNLVGERSVVNGSRIRQHYDVTMFTFATWRVFAFVFFAAFHLGRGSTSNQTKTYMVEYSDYVDVPSFKKRDGNRFDYYSLIPGIDLNDTISKVAVNKCCGWNQYFDLVNFTCVHSDSNLTDVFERNSSRYLFIENLPSCDNESVVYATVTSRVSIGLSGVAFEGSVFPSYCIDGNPQRPAEIVVLTCRDSAQFCQNRSCFRKCCPLGQSYGSQGRECQKSDDPFRPAFYNSSSLERLESVEISNFGIYQGDACGSKGKYILEEDLGEMSYLATDGSLYVPYYDERIFHEKEFCLEFVKKSQRMESFLCFFKLGPHFENSPLQFFLLSLGFIISCMFLLLTFLVYMFSPKCQNLYGKTLMCYIACLFTAYLCLAIIELKSTEIGKKLCTSLGYALLFSFLAAFFWLNVMSFDIWKTFSRLDRNVERSKVNKKNLRFFWYSVYAWTFPSAITAACAYANHMVNFPFPAIRPDIGEETCWFSKKKKGIYAFFISPIALVIIVNTIFFVQTAWKIWNVKSNVQKMEKQKTKRFSANKDQFLINGKLFIVMGITWSLEIVSFFAPHPIWYITDAANALHGVFIFAVFVLKKKVLHQVSQQVRAPLKRMRHLTSSHSEEEPSVRKNFHDLNTEGKSYTAVDSKT